MADLNRASAVEATAAVLELIATEQPGLLEFQLEALLNSAVRFAVSDLATAFDVPVNRLATVFYQASCDLDRLEQRRGAWRDPVKVLDSPNLAALAYLCRARYQRTRATPHRRKLAAMLRKLEAAQETARSKAWIEAFIG